MIRLSHRSTGRSSVAGYSLIEILVVVVMVGVLAAIAAPGWLAFANNRRASKGQDQVLQALRFAQQESLRQRRSTIVEFNPNDTDPPQIRYGRASTNANERNLEALGDGQFDPGMAALVAVDSNGDEVDNIGFDERGNIDSEADLPVTISVNIPPNGEGARRCVIVETILGAIRTEIGDACE